MLPYIDGTHGDDPKPVLFQLVTVALVEVGLIFLYPIFEKTFVVECRERDWIPGNQNDAEL